MNNRAKLRNTFNQNATGLTCQDAYLIHRRGDQAQILRFDVIDTSGGKWTVEKIVSPGGDIIAGAAEAAKEQTETI